MVGVIEAASRTSREAFPDCDAADICKIAVVSLSHGVVRKHGGMVVRATRVVGGEMLVNHPSSFLG